MITHGLGSTMIIRWVEDQPLVYWNDCSASHAVFSLDRSTGLVRHVASGMCVVPRGRRMPRMDTPPVLSSCAGLNVNEVCQWGAQTVARPQHSVSQNSK